MRMCKTEPGLTSFELCVLVLLGGFGSPLGSQANGSLTQTPRKPPPRVITQVPLQIRNSRARLEVMVNGQGPFPFGHDTGASQAAWVTRALVERLHLPIVEGFRVSDGSGKNSRNADGVRIDTLTLGHVSFNRVLAPVLGDGPHGEGDQEVYGTIGFEMFKDYLVTYDYPGEQLRIASGELPEPDGKTILGYTRDRGGRGSPQVPITIGALSVTASIDTGGIGAILLPLSFADKLPLRAPPRPNGRIASTLNEVDLYRSELDDNVHIGETVLHHPILFFAELIQQPALGPDLLHEFAITFDQKNRRVRFQSSSQRHESR